MSRKREFVSGCVVSVPMSDVESGVEYFCELRCGGSACEWSVPVSKGVESLPVS